MSGGSSGRCCRGQPTSFTHAAPRSCCTHQSGKTLSSPCRWSRCVSSRWHQMTVTLPRGGHRRLARVLPTTGLPPEINDRRWCKTYSSNAQTTDTHPFLSWMLWGGAEGKKSEESDFAKKLQISLQNPLPSAMLLKLSTSYKHCRGKKGRPRLHPAKREAGWISRDPRIGEFSKHRQMLRGKVLAKLLLSCPVSVGFLFFFKHQYCTLVFFLDRWTQSKHTLTLPDPLYSGVSQFVVYQHLAVNKLPVWSENTLCFPKWSCGLLPSPVCLDHFCYAVWGKVGPSVPG